MSNPARPEGIDLAARSRARRRALQATYAWQIARNPMASVMAQFEHEQEMEIADLDYFKDLLNGVERNLAEIDVKLKAFLDREVEAVDPIERAVLRLATYELLYRSDVPYRVVINEAIEIAKRFGADFGHTYINGVLDKAAAEWRSAEYRR
jgi:N utilization substance protein B